jgi:hypothetical protein
MCIPELEGFLAVHRGSLVDRLRHPLVEKKNKKRCPRGAPKRGVWAPLGTRWECLGVGGVILGPFWAMFGRVRGRLVGVPYYSLQPFGRVPMGAPKVHQRAPKLLILGPLWVAHGLPKLLKI